jgi:hypothetical protein
MFYLKEKPALQPAIRFHTPAPRSVFRESQDRVTNLADRGVDWSRPKYLRYLPESLHRRER